MEKRKILRKETITKEQRKAFKGRKDKQSQLKHSGLISEVHLPHFAPEGGGGFESHLSLSRDYLKRTERAVTQTSMATNVMKS